MMAALLLWLGVVLLVAGAEAVGGGGYRPRFGRERAGHRFDDRRGRTSPPELATSVVAAARGQRDIAVGNVVGSNIFLLGYFVAYTAYLIRADRQSPAVGSFTHAMLAFVPPLTAVALAFSTAQAVRPGDHRHPARRGVVRDAPASPRVRSRRDEP